MFLDSSMSRTAGPRESFKMDVDHCHIPVWTFLSTIRILYHVHWICENDGMCCLAVTSRGNPTLAASVCHFFHLRCLAELYSIYWKGLGTIPEWIRVCLWRWRSDVTYQLDFPFHFSVVIATELIESVRMIACMVWLSLHEAVHTSNQIDQSNKQTAGSFRLLVNR